MQATTAPPNQRRCATILTLLIALSLAISPAISLPAKTHWNRAFTASLWQPNERDFISVNNQTIRTQVRVNAGGPSLRLWLANDFGLMPVRIGAVTVTTGDGQIFPVTFSGKPGALVGQGASMASDAIPFSVKPFELVEVSVFLPEPTTLAGVHDSRADKLRISPAGDFTARNLWEPVATTNFRPLLAGIDVAGPRRPVIIAFGDSITDANSCPNSDAEPCRWSDVLARRLHAAGKKHIVLNQGIGGNTIVVPVTGPSAQARLDRDVLAIPNVTHLLLLEGINDIGKSGDSGITADELIEGYRQLTLRAQAHGIKVIAITVLPFEGAGYYRPEREGIRVKLNAWIRSAGIFDGVIDMEKVMADPANPKRLRSDLQVGDNLHPNALGQRVMGDAIPLSLFR